MTGIDPKVFIEFYEGRAPWDTGRPQPAVVALLERGLFRSPVLDIGCGAGENLILLTMTGLDVTGLELVPKAIEEAQQRAESRDIAIHAVVGDALHASTQLDGRRFRTVLDSAVFHVFSDAQRTRYVEQLRRLCAPAGHVFVIAFSDDEPGTDGPRRVSESELRDAFADGFTCESIEPTIYEHDGGRAKALLGIFRRDGFET